MRDGELRVEPCAKWIRGFRGGDLVVDTRAARYVWEHDAFPAYWFPAEDVRTELVPPDLLRAPDPDDDGLRGLVRVAWRAMDEWLEEDEPVIVHPRSPYTRVDVLASSRHVEVVVDGVKVADSTHPHVLFETGLPPRYYLPLADVRMDLLRPSSRQTQCPYKGTATYWSLEVGGTTHDDFVWTYRAPLPESQKIAGLVCFYNERVDLYVDGELQERPRTKFG